jgi:rhodanese-related sulfurtransferase
MRFRIAAGLVIVAVVLTACSGGATTGSSTAQPTAGASSSWQALTPAQLHDMLASQKVYLVNVHVPYEGEIPGTDAFIPYTDVAGELGKLPFDTQAVVIYCRSGNMSNQAAQAMVTAGAPAFYELTGGFYAWQAAGYPLKTESA